MFEIFKRKTSTGGKYISFEKTSFQRTKKTTVGAAVASSASNKKRTWRTCGHWNNVQRVMESLDSTDSTMELSTRSHTTCDDMGHSDWTNSTPMSSTTSVSQEALNTSMSCADISCNFALINHTRRRWNSKLRPLERCEDLDALAERHAKAMASNKTVYHNNPADLCASLKVEPKRRLGENVIYGSDPLDMHMKMLEIMTNYTNLVDCRYNSVGLATARATNGQYYLCILFRG